MGDKNKQQNDIEKANTIISTLQTMTRLANRVTQNTQKGIGPVINQPRTTKQPVPSKLPQQKNNQSGDIVFRDSNGKQYNGADAFIPQHLLKSQTGQAAKYAISRGDYFAGITFLCEGVRPNAFYFDPASGGKYGTLINTHPGITLPFQKDHEIRAMFKGTSIAGITEEIIAGVRSGKMTTNMKQARLQTSDYYNMFRVVEAKYTRGADEALKKRLAHVPESKALLAQGKSLNDVLNTVKQQLPAPSYSVLQQLSYKYGTRGINRFTKLLDSSIKAALDPANREQHLANGSKHIVYHYVNSKKQVIQDTRVMNIHRLFYTAGAKFSNELNMKLSSNETLTAQEEQLVNNVAKQAGIPPVIKNGKLDLPDGTKETIKSSKSEEVVLDTKAIEKGIAMVDNNFKVRTKVDLDTRIVDNKPKTDNVQKHKPSKNIGLPSDASMLM
jgi:hypothetical protein